MTPSGEYDLSFGDSGKIIAGIYKFSNNDDTINNFPKLLGLLNDGKLITRNSRSTSYSPPDHLIRYNANGIIDSSFGINGKVFINDYIDETSLIIQPDNKIIFGGNFYDTSNTYSYSNFAISRFNYNGTIDSSFGTDGLTITDFNIYSEAICSSLQQDNKILLGGHSNRISDNDELYNFALARYNNNNNILPVSFLSFTTTKQQQSVLLNWQTANEINSNYFSVQRSNNNKIFTDIGKVYSKSNFSKTQSYSTTDTKPLQGWKYYRL